MTAFSPVFLLCSERSGSNLFIRVLDSHPECCGPPPSHLIRTLALNLTRFGDVAGNDTDWTQLLDISSRIMQHQLGVWHGQWDAATLAHSTTERSARGIIAAVYEGEMQAQDKRQAVIKENRIHLFLPYLIEAFPQARYVWGVRDPRDMALSWKRSANHPGDVRTGTRIWLEDQERFRHIYGYLSHTGRIHRIRYEDMVNTPEQALPELCRFLNIPYTPAMLQFHEKADTQANAARIANWENLAKPLLNDNTGKYRSGLSEAEIRYIESHCHEEMQAHGYTPETRRIPPRDALHALEQAYGPEQTKTELRHLTPEEQRIRQNRQAVIDHINALPIRFSS